MPISRAAARSRVYRAFSRLPFERVQATRRSPLADRAMVAAERLAGAGPIHVGGGLGRGLVLNGGALPLRHVQAHGLVRGSLEPGAQEALRRSVAPGQVVCDIGANIGFFTLILARLTGPSGTVHAFEPSLREAEACRDNARTNRMGHVKVHEVAVGENPGHARFLVTDEPGWSHLADRGNDRGVTSTLTVPVVALDAFDWGEAGPPQVLKVDVEGSEAAVLRGMHGLLTDRRPVLIIELHGTNDEVADLLDAHGYLVENLDGHADIRDAGPTHVVARPRP